MGSGDVRLLVLRAAMLQSPVHNVVYPGTSMGTREGNDELDKPDVVGWDGPAGGLCEDAVVVAASAEGRAFFERLRRT